MSRTLFIGLAALAGLLLLMLCGAQAEDETVDMITIADTTGDWGYPSPYAHYARGPGYIRMSLIFDTLVWKDGDGFVPALAESWEYLSDEKAYLFHLRDGVTWNDGQPFTAQDVAFTFQYIKDHPYTWIDSSSVEAAEAVDDRTVKIALTKDYAPFLDQVAGTLPILPEHIYSSVSDPAGFKDPAALTGTGPFKLVDYNQAQGTYLYEANEGYYQGAPRVKQIKFVKLSLELSPAALEKGEVDAATVPGETVSDLQAGGFSVIEGSHDWLAKIMVNHKREPYSDVKFRRALYYAIDRQELVDTALRGYGLAGSPGLYASDSDWYNPDQEQYSFDPAKAGQLLEEMGYEKNREGQSGQSGQDSQDSQYYGKDGRTLETELLATSVTERQGELIVSQLKEAGISADLRIVDAKTLDSLVGEWQFDLALSGHGGLGADPAMLNRLVLDQKSFNSARYNANQSLNDVLEEQIGEMAIDARADLVDRAQELIAGELPALPMYYTDTYWAFNDKADYYYTYGGVGSGAPIALNKMIFTANR